MKKVIISLMIALFLFSAKTLQAQNPGDLDESFGSSGLVTTDIASNDDYGYSIAIQSDGKIVVVGSASNGSDSDVALARYNTDGSLDNTFGTNGKVITDIASNNDDYGHSIAIQSDGKIVVAGSIINGSNWDFVLARYNTDGSLDNTFGTGGKVITDFAGQDDDGQSVVIQSDGKIVIAGQAYNGSNGDFGLARYNTDGSLDNTFGTNGKVTTDIASNDDYGFSIAIQSDGKIVVAGQANNGSNNDFALARYNTDGGLDNTFDTDGKVTTDFSGNNDDVQSVVIQSGDKILVAGTAGDGSNDDFALARYTSSGSLDNTFGTGGKVITDFASNWDYGFSIAIQSDGKIVVAGQASNGSNNDVALARYSADGILDNTFGTGGKVITDFASSYDDGRSVVIQSDGKIVVVGYAGGASNDDFGLARYFSGLEAILPVELAGFSGTSILDGVKLNWQTETETDNAGFILLRNGVEIASYKNAEALKGHGTSSLQHAYIFTDSDVMLDETYTYQLISVDYSGDRHTYPQTVEVKVTETTTGGNKAYNYTLEQNYPNPFNPSTTISFTMKKSGVATLKVYDMLGRNVFEKQIQASAGGNTEVFNAQNLTSGIYFYQLNTEGFSKTMKMTLVR